MTERDFKNRSYRHSQLIDYVKPNGHRISCILLGINFEGGTFHLWVLPYEDANFLIKEQELHVSYEFVQLPLKRLKAVK